MKLQKIAAFTLLTATLLTTSSPAFRHNNKVSALQRDTISLNSDNTEWEIEDNSIHQPQRGGGGFFQARKVQFR